MTGFLFFNVLGAVGIAEIGDRTQLLSFVLAIRFRKPFPILCGILVGCLANHMVSVWVGEVLGELLTSAVLHWLLSISFAAMALWVLFPDRLDNSGAPVFHEMHDIDIFAITAISYFFAEIGDKTQIAAMAFGARFDMFLPIVLGTTVGATLADLPIVLGGCWAGYRFAPAWTRYVAAAIFSIEAALVFVS